MEQKWEERLLRLALAKGLVMPEAIAAVEQELDQGDFPTLTPSRWGSRVERLVGRGDLAAETVEALAAELDLAGGGSTLRVAGQEPGPRVIGRTSEGSRHTSGDAWTVASGITRLVTTEVPPDWDRYLVVRFLGEGGMGRVYEAVDPRLRRRVALKFLRGDDPEMVQRFLLEARAQAKLEHENVCRIHEVGEVGGRPFIAMQYIDGQSLATAAAGLQLAEKVAIMQTVASALHTAHQAGLIHRDIKPGNIMLERSSANAIKPYVMDFGLARELDAPSLTTTGIVIGTPAYMSPEQARGAVHELDCRTDVYSLGATLADLVLGHPPFVGTSLEVLLQVMNREPASLRRERPDVPVDLDTIVTKCLQKEPSARYQTAAELAEDLERFLSGEPVLARPIPSWQRLARKVRKNKVLAGVVGAATVLVLVAGGVAARAWWTGRQQEVLSRLFAQETARIEERIRLSAAKPLHDVRAERAQIAARLDEIEKEAARAGSSGFGPGHFALAKGYMALHDYRNAHEHLTKAWDGGYREPEVAHALGLTLAARYREETEALGRIANRAAREARRLEVQHQLRDPALSFLDLGRGIEVQAPEHVEAIIAFLEGRYDEATTKARAAVARIPWLVDAKRLEGDVWATRGAESNATGTFDVALTQLAQARQAYQEATRMAPSDVSAYEGLCTIEVHVMLSRLYSGASPRDAFDAAQSACDQALRADPDSVLSRNRKTRALLYWADYQGSHGEDPTATVSRAAALAEEVLRRQPDDPDALLNRGVSYRLIGDGQAATGVDPRDALDQAAASLARALARDPSAENAANNLGLVWLAKATYEADHGLDPLPSLDAAVEVFERSVAIRPSYSAYDNLGVVYWFKAHFLSTHGMDPTEAVQHGSAALDRALSIDPQDWAALNNLGLLHAEAAAWLLAGDRDPSPAVALAKERFHQSIAINPDNSSVFVNLAAISRLQARHELRSGRGATAGLAAAREAVAKALTINPSDPEAWWVLGTIELTAGAVLSSSDRSPEPAHSAAGAALAKALELNQGYSDALCSMGELARDRARWLVRRGVAIDTIVEQGLRATTAALAVNPNLAEACALEGELRLLLAKAERNPARQRAEANRACEALTRAQTVNPAMADRLTPQRADCQRLMGPATTATLRDGKGQG